MSTTAQHPVTLIFIMFSTPLDVKRGDEETMYAMVLGPTVLTQDTLHGPMSHHNGTGHRPGTGPPHYGNEQRGAISHRPIWRTYIISHSHLQVSGSEVPQERVNTSSKGEMTLSGPWRVDICDEQHIVTDGTTVQSNEAYNELDGGLEGRRDPIVVCADPIYPHPITDQHMSDETPPTLDIPIVPDHNGHGDDALTVAESSAGAARSGVVSLGDTMELGTDVSISDHTADTSLRNQPQERDEHGFEEDHRSLQSLLSRTAGSEGVEEGGEVRRDARLFSIEPSVENDLGSSDSAERGDENTRQRGQELGDEMEVAQFEVDLAAAISESFLSSLESSVTANGTGATERHLAQLRSISLEDYMALRFNGEERGDPHEICSVCRDSLECGLDLCMLPCGHVFHRGCATAWLTQRRTCPLCRHELSIPSNAWSSSWLFALSTTISSIFRGPWLF